MFISSSLRKFDQLLKLLIRILILILSLFAYREYIRLIFIILNTKQSRSVKFPLTKGILTTCIGYYTLMNISL